MHSVYTYTVVSPNPRSLPQDLLNFSSIGRTQGKKRKPETQVKSSIRIRLRCKAQALKAELVEGSANWDVPLSCFVHILLVRARASVRGRRGGEELPE